MPNTPTRRGPPPEDKWRGIFAFVVFIVALIVGSYTGNDNVRIFCAIMSAVGLTTAMVFVFKDFEKNNNDEESR